MDLKIDPSEKRLQDARIKSKEIISTKLVELEKSVKILFGKNFAEEVTTAIINRVMIIHEGMRNLDPTNPQDQYLLLKNTTYHSELVIKPSQDEFEIMSTNYLLRRSRRIHL